jgi:acetylornithine deacetylase/succinyl-diaminopimelate desuccinylase-like protein
MPDPVRLSSSDLELLLALMKVPSVAPLEGGDTAATRDAQDIVEQGAIDRGYALSRRDSPPLMALEKGDVPADVRKLASGSAAFLEDQPSLVLSLGSPQPWHRRLVINFHVDTVGPYVPPRLASRQLYGSGAVDDKGPGIAALVGVSKAFALKPHLVDEVEVQIASVPGEEGGAMGVYGTRWLVESGWRGRLMIFAEPTGGRVLDSVSATMTPLLRVSGADATDDRPTEGHNATLALGFLAAFLARGLDKAAAELGGRVCIAGMRTGDQHNRVYGTGELLLNIAYYDTTAGDRLAGVVEELLEEARHRFADEFAETSIAHRLIADWENVVRLDWVKRGLPTLANRDPLMESLLTACGLYRSDGVKDGTAFTCDAIWAGTTGAYVAVCGPGDLAVNGAHTPGEHVDLSDLESYATRIRDLVIRFAAHLTTHQRERAP